MAKRAVMVVAVLLWVIFFWETAYAYEYDEYNSITKFGRGLINGATGWLEIPKQIHLVSQEYDPMAGLIFGTIKGVCYAVIREGVGAFDMATFMFPPYDRPVLEPEFVFEGWE